MLYLHRFNKVQQKTVQASHHTGLTIIELLVAIGIIGIAFVAVWGLLSSSLGISALQKQTFNATAIAQETMEALRNFRDGVAWNNDDAADILDGLGIRVAGNYYHPVKTGSGSPLQWGLIPGQETINGFTRGILFSNVFRDGNDNISISGTADPDTKKAEIVVSWNHRGQTYQVRLVTYLTNWK
ncbi:MAG: type II secretion system protein [Patescibacteria group bacterium]